MSHAPSVLRWLQRPPRRGAGAPEVTPRPAADPGDHRGRVRRFLARQWHLHQLVYLTPEAWEPFPWEEGFLRWSGDRLDGGVLPPTVEEGPDRSGS
jgi:hypothetical protein